MSNTPAATLRDGGLKATVWKNTTNEGKTYYSVNITKSYKQDEEWKETTSFGADDVLKVANLAQRAYNAILNAKAQANNASQ